MLNLILLEGDDIESAVLFSVEFIEIEISLSNLYDLLLFSPVHRLQGISIGKTLAGFHLNKDDSILLLADEVNLPPSPTIVLFKDFITLSLKVKSCLLFSLLPEGLLPGVQISTFEQFNTGRNDLRWISQGPYLSKASRCSEVGYPLLRKKEYCGNFRS